MEGLIQELLSGGYLKTPRIIAAFRAIDRADFVLPEYKDEAYGNYPLPIGEGQTISQPLTVAFMLELLDPKPGEKILDVGAGSGWQTALISQAVGETGKVVAVERIRVLCEFAKNNLEKYRLIRSGRIEFRCMDATADIPAGPYDKIIAAASASKEIPGFWRRGLKIGGRIVAPVEGSIWLFIKKSETEWEEKEFSGFVFVPLVGGASGYKHDDYYRSPTSLVKSDFTRTKYRAIGGLLLVIGLLMGLFINEIYIPHPNYTGSKSVEISSGLGSRKIAEVLKKEGVIRSKWVFVMYVSSTGNSASLKPGNYVFTKKPLSQVVDDLVRGGTNELSITIPEGWDGNDIAEYLEEENIMSAEEFRKLIGKNGSKIFAEQFDFLKDKPSGVGVDGYLFPDTYRIFKGSGAENIVSKMLENFGKKLTPELREEITRQKKTIFEIVIMASLIEKEVATEGDRAIVSGILWRRLRIGMALQVDASVNYITDKKTPSVSKEDLLIDSPYNTYKYPGLPLGPISNPGLSAIRAAIYPKDSPYLYYLHAPDGQIIFSQTLEEHNEAKAKYLK